MLNLLQQMDTVHWWLLAGVLLILAAVRRSAAWLWPGLCATGVGYLVLIQPGMFWYRQWLFFLLPSLVLWWLNRSRNKTDKYGD